MRQTIDFKKVKSSFVLFVPNEEKIKSFPHCSLLNPSLQMRGKWQQVLKALYTLERKSHQAGLLRKASKMLGEGKKGNFSLPIIYDRQ